MTEKITVRILAGYVYAASPEFINRFLREKRGLDTDTATSRYEDGVFVYEGHAARPE